MADLTSFFDGDKTQAEMAAEALSDFQILRPGWHTCICQKAEIKTTRAGGKMLEVTLQTTTEDVQVKARYNIENSNPKAQMVGRNQMMKLAESCGIQLKQSEQLHGLPVDVKVTVEEFESNTTPGKMLKSNQVVDSRKAGSGIANNATKNDATPW